ncbi:MAG: sensor histidine kinase [Sulfuritalea sp.]|nr:sensor histidine kinase [Sulfuritalea sp.]
MKAPPLGFHRLHRWLLVFFIALLPAIHAEAVPLMLTADMRHASLEGRLEHYVDASGDLTFEAARLKKFALLPRFLSLGHDTAVHWYRFEVGRAMDAPSHWILSVGLLNLDEIDVHVEQPDGTFRVHLLGDNRPFASRPLQTRLALVPIEVFGSMRVYLRVRTSSTINVTAELWQAQALATEETRSNLFQGGYFGILLIIAVFYGVLGAWSRDTILLAYAGYIATLIPMHMGFRGYLPMLLASDIPWLNDAVWRVSFLSGTVFVVLMWDRLLELQRNFPRIHRLFLLLVLLNAALIPIVVTPLYVAIGPWLNYAIMMVAVAAPILTGILWWRNRRAELLVYFVAFLIPCIGGILQGLLAMGDVPHNALTVNAYQVASLFHVVVMSFGLALRLRQMQRDKLGTEQDLAVTTQRAQEQRRFVAMLSHEFRNPLAAIDRSAQMIRIKTPELAQPEAQRLDQIRANAATLAGFVDNFLMTEALDHGALALKREHCAVRPLLEAAVLVQGEHAGERIRLAVTPDNASFDLDPTLIGVAVGNLLGNALRYSPADSAVEVAAILDGAGLRIRVTDQGPGMREDELAQLGMPYYRAASSLGKKGSGLGYHFTRRIVETHGGTLTALAQAGSGLEVEIRLT